DVIGEALHRSVVALDIRRDELRRGGYGAVKDLLPDQIDVDGLRDRLTHARVHERIFFVRLHARRTGGTPCIQRQKDRAEPGHHGQVRLSTVLDPVEIRRADLFDGLDLPGQKCRKTRRVIRNAFEVDVFEIRL